MDNNNNLYSKLGASSKKEDIHEAIKNIDKGLFPGAFCKIVEDIAGRKDYCSIFHADGAGTKSSLAYMYYKETDDVSVFKGIVQDAVVMNIDDVLCVGATGPIYLSNNLGRNSRFISGDIIKTIITEYDELGKKFSDFGLNLIFCGGETADVGDLVKTLIVDASIFTSMKKKEVINANNIKKNDVILGLASYGQATYEHEFNSGISSNGLTLARHGTLSHDYFTKYPEAYDHNTDEKFIFFGKYKLTDKLDKSNLTIGKALLSPTRTYAPIILKVLAEFKEGIHGIIHNTGGGQTKILKFGSGVKYIKNNLFDIPQIFELIQQSSGTHWKEMYEVFNMGHRMEIFCDESIANDIIKISRKFNVDSKVIGHCEKSSKPNMNNLEIQSEYGSFIYN